jgi:hypothetical protein
MKSAARWIIPIRDRRSLSDDRNRPQCVLLNSGAQKNLTVQEPAVLRRKKNALNNENCNSPLLVRPPVGLRSQPASHLHTLTILTSTTLVIVLYQTLNNSVEQDYDYRAGM